MSDNFRCPDCESDNLIVREVTSFYLNSGEYFCNSVKSHDDDAQVACLDCNWEGQRKQFAAQEPKP